MSNARRGADLERQVMVQLAARGWCVIRAAGSHGAADLWAARDGWPVMFVQCKQELDRVEYAEWDLLWKHAVKGGGMAVVADRSGPRRTPALWQLIGPRPKYARMNGYVTPIAWDDV